jgi:hypothetical protein
LASSHDLSPLLEYDQLHPSALEPARSFAAPSARHATPKGHAARRGLEGPGQEVVHEPSTEVRDPKNPSPSVQNASQTPHGSRFQAIDPTASPEGPITRPSTSVRPPEDRSTKINSDTLEIRRTPQRHLTPLPSPRGTHQQTSESPQSSEELITDSSALRAPWNSSSNGRLTARLRRADWRASRSSQSS